MTDLEADRWAALASRLETIDPTDGRQAADGIAALYETLAATPEQILQDYRGFAEAALTEGIDDRARRVLGRDLSFIRGADPLATLLDAARLLRALEQVALEVAHQLSSEESEDLERLCVTADGKHFVIPRMTPLEPTDGKPFLRRALLNTRVIPTKIGTFRVRLHRLPLGLDRAGADDMRQGAARRYGAALFPGLVPILSPPEMPEFLVEGLNGFDAEGLIAEHLERARGDHCGVIVWGELTMPEASIAQVHAALAETALEGQPPMRYLVAGSWHRDVDGMRNVASVLDGYGRRLFEVFKWAKFDIGGRLEAIVPGDEVHVLVCEDELVTVAVCRDFLEAMSDVPYRSLNVDVAIVPSMIGCITETSTLAGHAATADTMRNRFGTRTLAVAQPAAPDAEISGKVMAFPRHPLEEPAINVEGPWYVSTLEPR